MLRGILRRKITLTKSGNKRIMKLREKTEESEESEDGCVCIFLNVCACM